jgi:hypothetical protein
MSVAVETLFKMNANCETVFSSLDEKDVHFGGVLAHLSVYNSLPYIVFVRDL